MNPIHLPTPLLVVSSCTQIVEELAKYDEWKADAQEDLQGLKLRAKQFWAPQVVAATSPSLVLQGYNIPRDTFSPLPCYDHAHGRTLRSFGSLWCGLHSPLACARSCRME